MISVIIPVYLKDEELLEMTDRCIDSLFETASPDEVIVVDDCSPIHASYANVECIRRDENGRFPKAVNTGLKHAKGDIIIVSNNDIVFYPGWIEGLTGALERFDIASIRVTDSDGWETEDKYTKDDRFGSLWAMKREVYESLGGLDEEFMLGAFEDLDYYNRAKKAGFKIGKYHGALVEHIGRATNDKEFPNKEDFISSREVYKKKYGRVD